MFTQTIGINQNSATMTQAENLKGTPFEKIAAELEANFQDNVALQYAFTELTAHVKISNLIDLIYLLKKNRHCKFNVLIDICGVDIAENQERFTVVYHFLSTSYNHRIRVKVATDEDTPVPSIIDIFPAAEWFEREAFDMYGILFANHPDLRRLLTDYGFEGYPLRKDFPLSGFYEVNYDPEQRKVVSTSVSLPQEYREFDTLNPWEDSSDDNNDALNPDEGSLNKEK